MVSPGRRGGGVAACVPDHGSIFESVQGHYSSDFWIGFESNSSVCDVEFVDEFDGDACGRDSAGGQCKGETVVAGEEGKDCHEEGLDETKQVVVVVGP